MFESNLTSRRLIAFVLPLTFVWSWAACALLCGEIAEHRDEQTPSRLAPAGEKSLAAFDTERCPVTKTGAIVEARQTFFAHAPAIQNTISRARREASFVRARVYPADVSQNAPPHSSFDPPLFLRHGAFRI